MADNLNEASNECEMDNSSPDVSIFNRITKNATINKKAEIKGLPVTERSGDFEKYYNMTGHKYLFVFNHFKYDKRRNGKTPTDRNGTGADMKRLISTFSKFNFIIEDFSDFSYEHIMEALQHIVISDHSETACVATVIMTHGNDGGYVEARDKDYPLTDVFNKFIYSNNEHLVNKPKLFFIQACRGDELDSGKIVADGGSSNNLVLLPTHIDFLTVYSTVPGFVSWRDSDGSWLIQTLCDCLEEYGDDHHLLEIITFTNNRVAYDRKSNTPSNRGQHHKKQMPETQFTLSKLLKFR